jgi:hypothetical protein
MLLPLSLICEKKDMRKDSTASFSSGIATVQKSEQILTPVSQSYRNIGVKKSK